MTTEIDQNTVHNWHVKQVRDSRAFTDEMRTDLEAAHARHHNEKYRLQKQTVWK